MGQEDSLFARETLPSAAMAGFPDPCWVLESSDGRPACYFVPDWTLAGLALFSHETCAWRYAEWLPEETGLVARPITLDAVIAHAGELHPFIECVAWVDDLQNPVLARLDCA